MTINNNISTTKVLTVKLLVHRGRLSYVYVRLFAHSEPEAFFCCMTSSYPIINITELFRSEERAMISRMMVSTKVSRTTLTYFQVFEREGKFLPILIKYNICIIKSSSATFEYKE